MACGVEGCLGQSACLKIDRVLPEIDRTVEVITEVGTREPGFLQVSTRVLVDLNSIPDCELVQISLAESQSLISIKEN